MFLWNKIELNNFEGCDNLKPDEELIVTSIKNARSELEQAVNLFNEMTDFTAIDYASYNLLAVKAKYSYLMQIAKEKGLSVG